ncbi:MAG: ATP-binding cassette domain-containing protein, partial [Pseudoclavibacter sp.]|nr:ATP-binding cassette domain-containing protein [Pseudoclavibacter sp.]
MNGPDERPTPSESTAQTHRPNEPPTQSEPTAQTHRPQTAAAGADGELLLDCRRVSIRHEGAARPSPAGVDLTVRRGEAVLLLGPSGCGKSTLALAVAGLVPGAVPARVEGEVRVRRSDAAGGARLERLGEDAAPGAADVAVVFQDADAQLVAASVFDEVAFGLENLLRPVEEIERRVEWALRRVRLWERRDEAPELLSGGERQRLAIAAAVALGAPLLVLDEPTANLDPAARAEVYELLAEIMRDGEHGMLLVEHNLDEAVRVATRLVVLDGEGAVIADGPPRELFAERGAEFERLGVWMPLATLAAERLRAAGWPLRGRPLSGAELARAIDEAVARLPPSGGPEAPPPGPARQEAERPAALRCEGLGVRRRGRTILHDVSLRLPRGSFTALVGRGGAGKSTLLLALAGLEAPEEGRVLAGERPLTGLPAHELRSRVGFVFQNPEHQFVRRTAREELELELRLRGGPGERRELAEAQLGRFGLAEHAERHPFLLSGGQKRRLSVATALVEAAPVLLLDEPTFGQDRGRARALLELLAELHAAGTTILMATHDLQLVAEHASHIAVMAEGRLLRFGTAGEVLASDALAEAGLGEPPLAAAMRRVRSLPGMRRVTRLSDLDDCPPAPRPAGPALEEPADPGSGPEPERAPEAAPEPRSDGARAHDPDAAPGPA